MDIQGIFAYVIIYLAVCYTAAIIIIIVIVDLISDLRLLGSTLWRRRRRSQIDLFAQGRTADAAAWLDSE